MGHLGHLGHLGRSCAPRRDPFFADVQLSHSYYHTVSLNLIPNTVLVCSPIPILLTFLILIYFVLDLTIPGPCIARLIENLLLVTPDSVHVRGCNTSLRSCLRFTLIK